MEIQADFKELLALLNAHDVAYVVVGAYALAFHGAPRYTGDLDILIEPSAQNAEKIIQALNEFGFASLELSADDFTTPDQVLQLGVAPVRVDIITSLTGVSWSDAKTGSSQGNYGGITVPFLGRKELIRNKKALGRTKDLADIEALGEQT